MLKEKKLKNGKIMLEGTTPKGKSLYAKVHEPQSKIGGQPVDPFYSITLLMDKDDPAAQNFIQQLDNFMKQAELLANEFVSKAKGRQRQKPQLQNANYGEYFDDEGNETNYYFIKAKAKASGTTQAGKKWNFKPSVFDAKGTPFPTKNPPLVGNDSICRVAVGVTPYCQAIGYGLSIHLDAVQVLDLVEYNNRSAKGYGFETEEDGYSINNSASFPEETDEEDGAVFSDDHGEMPKSYRDEAADF